jgi:hypothetical protein
MMGVWDGVGREENVDRLVTVVCVACEESLD